MRAWRALLSAEEVARHASLHFERDRHLYRVSHAMVRYVLAGYLGTEPRQLDFTTSAYGRPEIARRPGMPNLRFNLSHTRGLAALVVNHDSSCGVDVETDRPAWDPRLLAGSVLSADERDALRGLPEQDWRQAFLRLWTLKEAYVKAQGRGLSMPLNGFSFDMGDDIRIRFPGGLDEDSREWRFVQHRPSPEHVLAVAIRQTPGSELSVVWRELAPEALPAGGAAP